MITLVVSLILKFYYASENNALATLCSNKTVIWNKKVRRDSSYGPSSNKNLSWKQVSCCLLQSWQSSLMRQRLFGISVCSPDNLGYSTTRHSVTRLFIRWHSPECPDLSSDNSVVTMDSGVFLKGWFKRRLKNKTWFFTCPIYLGIT